MKRTTKRLALAGETLRVLRGAELRVAAGGMTTWTAFSRDLRTCLSCDCEGTD